MSENKKKEIENEKFEVTELEEEQLDDVDGGADVNFGCNSGCGRDAMQAL